MMTTLPDLAVEIRGLTKRYGKQVAVDGVSFDVRRGEIFGLLGKNGAGKTSIFEIIEGLRQPTSGTVLIWNNDVVRQPAKARRHIGATLQNSTFFAGLPLHELVDLYAALHGCKVNADDRLARFDLTDKRNSLVRFLSGGQKQRFAICIATVSTPDVLLLDEPSAGLDVGARRAMWELIRGLRDEGRTVILSTHYMEEAEQLCDRVAILETGRIAAVGQPRSMITQLTWPQPDAEEYERPPSLEDVFLKVTSSKVKDLEHA